MSNQSAYARRTVKKQMKESYLKAVKFRSVGKFFLMSSPFPVIFQINFFKKKTSPQAKWTEFVNFSFFGTKYTFGRYSKT